MSDKLSEQLKRLNVGTKLPKQVFTADGRAGGAGGGGGGGGQVNYVTNNYIIAGDTNLPNAQRTTQSISKNGYEHIVGKYVRIPGEPPNWEENIISLNGQQWTRLSWRPGAPPLEYSFVFGEQYECDYGGLHFTCTTTSDGNTFYTKETVYKSGRIHEQTIIEEFKDNGMIYTVVGNGRHSVVKYKKVTSNSPEQAEKSMRAPKGKLDKISISLTPRNIRCDHCSGSFPRNSSFKCMDCHDYDCCKGCFKSVMQQHTSGHRLISIYFRIKCDGCRDSFSRLKTYQCTSCLSYDLCDDCYCEKDILHPGHSFVLYH